MTLSSENLPQFPKDFLFGVATAAYQIEGAAAEDGRKASIWDAFSHTPGRVLNGDTGDVACDHYHRWSQDLDLVQGLNVGAYRFSLSWSRLIPDGLGAINPKGVAFYDKLIDGCLERHLKPYATLYHWDLPLALQDTGGWTSASTADAFAQYAEMVTNTFGDRLEALTTFNEPWCSAVLGHLLGVHAPGETDLDATIKTIHNQHLAHGLATQAIKSLKPELAVGIVLNLQSIYAATDKTEDIAAAERHRVFHNQMYTDPLFSGRYPETAIEAFEPFLPQGWQDDLKTIYQPMDYWGLNYYTPARIEDASNTDLHFPATKDHPLAQGTPVTDLGWEIAADTFKDLLIDIHKRYDLPPCYITENGACFNEEPIDDVVNDIKRIEYLDSHLRAVLEAIKCGVPIKGYFAWSLMDNFEWSEGYGSRFGLVHVDYTSQKRTIKQSGHWFAEVVKPNLSSD